MKGLTPIMPDQDSPNHRPWISTKNVSPRITETDYGTEISYNYFEQPDPQPISAKIVETSVMQFLTVEQVADLLQVDVQTVRRWLRAGSLKGIPFGGRTGWRIDHRDMETFINARRNIKRGKLDELIEDEPDIPLTLTPTEPAMRFKATMRFVKDGPPLIWPGDFDDEPNEN
jgi:excisionase family DNA binding protein